MSICALGVLCVINFDLQSRSLEGARAFWSAPVLWRSAIFHRNTTVDLRIKVRLFTRHERFVLIADFEAIDFEAINGFNHGGRRGAFKPGSGAPGILVGDGNEAMVHRVLVDVVETRERSGVRQSYGALPFSTEIRVLISVFKSRLFTRHERFVLFGGFENPS